jgi:hypothetical protein
LQGTQLSRAKLSAECGATALAFSHDGTHLCVALQQPKVAMRVYSTDTVRIPSEPCDRVVCVVHTQSTYGGRLEVCRLK